MIAEAIYFLCAGTSFFCFASLFRGYLRRRSRLLLWSSSAFLAFTVANCLLVVDLVVLPSVSLLVLRNLVTLVGTLLLLGGLIFDS